mgnify:CR=1 FL=1
MKTITVNPKSVSRKWKLVDAAEKPMGRVASEVARLLMGKHKAIYSPNVDTGDFVVVINAAKVLVTGNKNLQKEYFHHTGHIAGERWINFADLMAKDPTAPLDRGPAELDESLNTRTLAEIYFEQGLVDKALDIYEDLARKEPENAEIMNRLMEVEKAYREKFGGESNG